MTRRGCDAPDHELVAVLRGEGTQELERHVGAADGDLRGLGAERDWEPHAPSSMSTPSS